MSYLSLSSGNKRREVVPVALADNGLRWHVRAFDRDKARFADFVLTRISKVQELAEAATQSELLPHPGLEHFEAIEADYGMSDAVLRLKARAALAGYVL